MISHHSAEGMKISENSAVRCGFDGAVKVHCDTHAVGKAFNHKTWQCDGAEHAVCRKHLQSSAAAGTASPL